MNDTRTFFAFQEKTSGELVRIDLRDDLIALTRPVHNECPVFEAESVQHLADVLVEDTPYYNSSEKQPGWGPYKPQDLVPVRVTVTCSSEEVALPEIPRLTPIEVRSIPANVARRYAGLESLQEHPEKQGFVFLLAELPAGETLESAQRWVGQLAWASDRYTQRHVFALVPVPEEYEPLTKGRSCALCIASGC